MWLVAITYSMEEYSPDQDEIEDGEVSIVFWSCAFVILLIVTVWFYITEIAPMRKAAAGRRTEEEIDREEEVAKRILEHLSEDLQFKSDTSEQDGLEKAASAIIVTKREASSVYEYVDDEIHIHYSNYGWDDECDDSSDFSSGLGATRRHSMENMDLIFPGVLPSIVEEEEEIDEETDTESSEKSQDTDVDDVKLNGFSNLTSVYKPVVNNNAELLESSLNVEYNYPETREKIIPFIETQGTSTKESKPREASVVICKSAERNSLEDFENVVNADTTKPVPEPEKTNQNDTALLSSKSDNRSQVIDTENGKDIPSSEPARQIAAQESVMHSKFPSVSQVTSGSIDIISDKDQKKTTQDNLYEVNGDLIENTSVFTISNCDLAPTLKQDANEIDEPKLCASNEEKIACAANGLEPYTTRDIRSKNLKNDENVHDNIANEPDSELSDASSEDTSGLTGIKMDVNKSGIAEFNLNGFVDDITGTNEHTTHAWTFFSMSGSDENTTPAVKGISNEKSQYDQVEVPKIIIDSYDEGLQSDKLTLDENSMDVNANATHGDHSYEMDTFETDIDIDDVDLIDSDELEEEGEFSIYFKRHVSVTDLDKILSEEGQPEANGESKEVLETELSVDELPQVEHSIVDISTSRTVTSEEKETNNYHPALKTEYINDDGCDTNIQKSIIVTSKLSDCLDKQPTLNEAEQLEEFDSLLKNYSVETLMDDVSFEKDGVYGELVLSKLNEDHKDQTYDANDSYGDDWSGFAEEYRRERWPLLYTIPEDEEIGPPVSHYRRRENKEWGEATTWFNSSTNNEPSAAKEPGEKAPIATMDGSDSEYDLDDHSSSENEKSGTEDIEEKDWHKTSEKTDKTVSYNGVTENGSHEFVSLNGVTEKPDIGGVRDAIDDKLKRSEEPELLEEIPTYNGVTSNGGNTDALDNTRSVKIVKKIKIFVRKEVTVSKNEQELQSSKQLIEDFGDQGKDNTEPGNETSAKKEVNEQEIILECREGKTHPANDVIKEENASVTKLMEPLNFEEELCDISEINAKKMETIAKKEDYAPAKPELKIVDEVVDAPVSKVQANTTERDITQYFTEPAAQNDQTGIDVKVVDETDKLRQSLVEGAPKSDVIKDAERDITQQRDITQPFAKPSEQTDLTKADDQPESKHVEEGTKQAKTPVRGKLFSPTKTRQKHLSRMVARFETKIEEETVKARRSSLDSQAPPPVVTQDDEKRPAQHDQPKTRKWSLDSRLPKRDVTHHVEKPAQHDQAKDDAKRTPETVKAIAPSVDVPKRDVTQYLEKQPEETPPTQKDQTKIRAKPELKATPETTKTSALPAELDVSKPSVTQHFDETLPRADQVDGKPESELTPEAIKASALPVEVKVAKSDVTQHLEKLPAEEDKTKIGAKPESKVTPEAIKTGALPVEVKVTKSDVTQHLEKLPAEEDQPNNDAKPESKVTPAAMKTSALPVDVKVTKRDVTQSLEQLPAEKDQSKIDAKPETKSVAPVKIKAKVVPVEANVRKRYDTTKAEKPSPLTKIDAKSTPEPIKTSVPKRDVEKPVTQDAENLPAPRTDTEPKSPETVKTVRTSPVEAAVPAPDIENEVIEARISTVKAYAPERDISMIDAKPEPNKTPETIKTSADSVEAVVPNLSITKDFTKPPAQDDKTKTESKEETDVKEEKPRSNVGLKLFISGKSNKKPEPAKEDTKEKPVLSEEIDEEIVASLPVKISVQGKDSEEDRDKRRVLSPTRMSPKSWEKKTKKTYLTSRNIRLTKSHEDLSFAERAPEEPQDSIEEEDTTATDRQSPNLLTQSIPEDDAIESVESSSIHTAKITVQEVVGEKKRILILNVRKRVHGAARWKSLNDLDAIKRAMTPPRRSSDLANALASFGEEEENATEDKGQKFLPIKTPLVKTPLVKTPLDRQHSAPEMGRTSSETQVVPPRRSPILKVTALQERESKPENDSPIVIKARVMPVLHEGEPHDETVREIKEKDPPRQEFKTRVTQVSSRDYKSWEEHEEERMVHVAHVSPVVEAFPKLERETVTEISEPATKGNKIKVHVARVKPTTAERPPEIEDKVPLPYSSPKVEAIPKSDNDPKIEVRTSQVSPTVEGRYRRGRESGYGSLEIKDNDARSPNGLDTAPSVRLEPISALLGGNDRSVSSVSSMGSLEDEYDGERLGESRVMVTDLDALLAQQSATQTEEKPRPESPETHEVTEKVHVWARMEPRPEKVIRINSEEKDDDDSLVIRHVQTEEPIVIQPVVVTEAAPGSEESNVISAFLVNDGYDDDELDEVFLEEYPPYGNPDSPTGNSRHSSDADSETSSVNSLPLKHRHRHTRASLEATTTGTRVRTDSSGSSKTATPVAELENEKAATSSGSSTPEVKANEAFLFNTPQQAPPLAVEKPTKFTSAFITLSRSAEVQRPRARSDHSARKSDEELSTQRKELGPTLQKKTLGTSVQDVQTMPGLDIDRQRFKEAADSRKSMPDLTKKGHQINESPFLRGLSAHTRRWLSQNNWMDSGEQQDKDDLMTSDLFLYPSKRFQPGTNIDASFMSLAGEAGAPGERDFPDDISVSTLSTRPQSPMSEFSFAGETPFWGMRRGSTTTIKCSNPRCEKEEVLFAGEKTTYTSCPACFTYYCSRGCRRFHWSEHKKICFFGRINSYIRSFIYLCHKKEALKNQLSKAAREGFKRKGRGCVLVTFASPQLARKFMTTGCTFFPNPPTYSSLQDLQAEGVVSKHRVALTQNIKDYEPEEEFVLNLAIIAGKMENLPANPVPRRKVNTVLQVIKIPLSSQVKETVKSTPAPIDPKTETKVFYLPKCARHEFVNENEARRHYCRNISKNLKQYGIKLKNDYPDVYEKLCLYVDQNIHFKEPLVVYGNQGKKIVMCKIMPEAADDAKTK